MSNKGSKLGLGIAIGAAAGAVAGVITGLLVAPKSGKETRADLKKKAGEMKVGFSKFGKHAGNAVEGAKEGFKKEVK